MKTKYTSLFQALIELAKAEKNEDCAYGVVTLLVNVTNSFEKQEIMPEMLELAKFAKHHIPQDHELDDEDFVDKRIYVSRKKTHAKIKYSSVPKESNVTLVPHITLIWPNTL